MSAGNLMAYSQLSELLAISLPYDVDASFLADAGISEECQDNAWLAAAHALQNCPYLNWDAYLAQNPDVASAGIPPWLHYARHGVYEGRKLLSYHPLKDFFNPPQQPLISVIIPNHNNELFLPKCVESILAQTMPDIEIILVDDCSADQSMSIIAGYALKDPRIKVIQKFSNIGTFMGRKEGVLAATGKYIMFVDADDFLDINACERLCELMRLGYDMVEFGVHVLNPGLADAGAIANCTRYLNGGENRLYDHMELMQALFVKQSLPWSIWNKIYLAEVCKEAHRDVEDGYYVIAEDVYEMLAMARYARNMLKVEDKLYFYNYATGITDTSNIRAHYKKWFQIGEVTQKIGNFAEKNNLNIYFDRINEQHCFAAIAKWLQVVEDDELAPYLDMIKQHYGFETFLKVLVERFANDILRLSSKLSHYMDRRKSDKAVHHISLCCPGKITAEFKERIRLYSTKLLAIHFHVTLIADRSQLTEEEYPEKLTILHIHSPNGTPSSILEYLDNLHSRIRDNKIDMALYPGEADATLLWDMLLWDHYQIPVVVSQDKISSRYFPGCNTAKISQLDGIFKCAAAVICPTNYSTTIARAICQNAWHIPIGVAEAPQWVTEPAPSIAVYFDSDSPSSQIGQCLLVFKHVAMQCPWVKMIVIGRFDSKKQRQAFIASIKKLRLTERIHLTDRTDKYQLFFAKCGVFLSTAYDESGLLPIMQAQSFGLPCVIYDIPADMAQESNGIVAVPQRDYEAAAEAIIHLLESPDYWEMQAARARQSFARNQQRFQTFLSALMKNATSLSLLSPVSQSELKRYMNYIADYAMRPNPQLL